MPIWHTLINIENMLLLFINVLGMTIHPSQIMMDSHNDSTTNLSVTYEVIYQRNEEDYKKEKDLMRLDIGMYSSQYVSVIGEFISKNRDISAKGNGYPYPDYTALRDEVYKNTPQKGYMQFVHMPGWVSCREKIEGLFDWKLEKGDSVVCEYQGKDVGCLVFIGLAFQ